MPKHWQTIKVRDYGDEWLNRLAVILKMTEQMEEREFKATLDFVVSRYNKREVQGDA